MGSLAEFLGVGDQDAPPREPPVALDNLSPKQFCQAILNSSEFRTYLLNGISLGDLPAAVIIRVMDIGWGKPAERIEHTGKDGQPIETITEVRRVLVRAEQQEEVEAPYTITH